jgi:hypothetical protein
MSQPVWIRAAHGLATHGQPRDEQTRVLQQWASYLHDAQAAGDSAASGVLAVFRSCAAHIWDRLFNGQPTVLPLSAVIGLGAVAELVFATDDDPFLTNLLELFFALAMGAVAVLLLVHPQNFHPRMLAVSLAAVGVTAPLVAPGVTTMGPGWMLVVAGCVLFGAGTFATAGILTYYRRSGIPRWWWYPLRVSAAGALAIGLANSMRAGGMERSAAGAVATLVAALAGVWAILAVERFKLLYDTIDEPGTTAA